MYSKAEIDAHNARVYENLARKRGTHLAVLYAMIFAATVTALLLTM